MKKLIYSFAVVAFFLTACKNSSTTTATESTTPTEQPAAAVADANVTEVSISGDDQMKFDTDEITVKAGQQVRLTLVHTGKLPKEGMGHNWILLKDGVDLDEFAGEAMKAKDTDYVPASREGDIIAHTKVIGGGESTTIDFAAPAPGTYQFLCSFPGHSGMMRGHFIVE
ncbi:MAG: azurin [Chitinophagales bacterium]|nr:azurin [Chitinophagales bacterium]